jgi:hypothetical protein
VKERFGKVPSDLSFRNPTIVKEPTFWFLVFDQDGVTINDIRSKFGAPGPLLIAWMQQVEVLWIPSRASESDRSWLHSMLQKLQMRFQMLAELYFNHPAGRPLSELLQIADPCIKEAEELTKEIEGRNIRITVGQKGGQKYSISVASRADLREYLHQGNRIRALVCTIFLFCCQDPGQDLKLSLRILAPESPLHPQDTGT